MEVKAQSGCCTSPRISPGSGRTAKVYWAGFIGRSHESQHLGRSFADIDIQAGGTVAFGDDIDALAEPLKAGMAFTLGAMGSPRTNFYNDAFSRAGWAEVADEVRQLWISGKRDAAAARVPDQMIIESNLLGDETAVRARIEAYRAAGVTTLRLNPVGASLAERLENLGRAMDLM